MPDQWHRPIYEYKTTPIYEYKTTPIYEYKTTPIYETTTEISIPTQQTELESFTQKCKCPEPFISRLRQSDQRCICDCLDRDHHCIRIKRGRHKLSPTAARCVRGGECSEPLCDFEGTYSKLDATCIIPKHLNSIHKYKIHSRHRHQHQRQNHHHLHERD
jgi:hypothetical protein